MNDMDDILTPLDIYNKEFNKSFSVWAYNTEEVDQFLDLVGESYEKIYVDNEELSKRVAELEERLQDYKQREETLNKTIDTVKATADNQQKTAKQEAETIIQNAQEKAANIKEQAKNQAELIIEKAEIKAEKILKKADEQIEEKKIEYKNLIESEQLFKIKFRTLLDTFLNMLEEKDELDNLKEEFSKEIDEEFVEGDLDMSVSEVEGEVSIFEPEESEENETGSKRE